MPLRKQGNEEPASRVLTTDGLQFRAPVGGESITGAIAAARRVEAAGKSQTFIGRSRWKVVLQD